MGCACTVTICYILLPLLIPSRWDLIFFVGLQVAWLLGFSSQSSPEPATSDFNESASTRSHGKFRGESGSFPRNKRPKSCELLLSLLLLLLVVAGCCCLACVFVLLLLLLFFLFLFLLLLFFFFFLFLFLFFLFFFFLLLLLGVLNRWWDY